MSIIDTHLHLIYPDRLSYPWLAGAPGIDKPWHIESYFAEAEPLGIEAALQMEVDVAAADIEAETRFVTQLQPTPEKVAPYVEHAISCFGWERVVWGSDHPVVMQHASLTRWVEITRALLAGASADEKTRLLRENGRRVYRLE